MAFYWYNSRMPSFFPNILFLSIFAPLILRLVASALALNLAKKENSHQLFRKKNWDEKIWSAVEIISSLLVLIGLFTQPAALALFAIYSRKILLKSKHPAIYSEDKKLYWLLAAIFASLILTGPGLFAFDLSL